MDKFGLIGETLKHSYSQIIHSLLGGYSYHLYEVKRESLEDFVCKKELRGFNVTIPYKKEIMKYLDGIHPLAQDIGAVNTVVNKNGELWGYNTDIWGMKYMLDRVGISLLDKKVMILGTGGTGNTALALAKMEGAKEILRVSRSGELNYSNYKRERDTQVIINTTPVGTYPDNYSSPITLEGFDCLEGVADVVYNPNLTPLTFMAKERGIKYTNGLPMLVAQAKYAMELFFDKKVADSEIERVLDILWKEKLNLVLVGMAGCGKTSIGKILAEKLEREFVDTDLEIERRLGQDIPTIFKEKGEDFFREEERKVLKEVGMTQGKVIATGGGVVKDLRNLHPLASNGTIFWINRKIENLSREGRPLSYDLDAVKKLFEERKANYACFSHFKIDNDGDIQDAVKEILAKL